MRGFQKHEENFVRGEYWIDVDDPIIRKLVQNADKVLASKPLLEAARIYARTIPFVCTIPPVLNPVYSLHLVVESSIASFLGSVRVKGYDQRQKETSARFLRGGRPLTK